MSDSDDSFQSLGSNGLIKCSSPPASEVKFINEDIEISSQSSSDEDSDSSDSISSESSDSSSSSSQVECNKFLHYDKSDDENHQYRTEINHIQELTLKIRYCFWTIKNFSSCSLNKKGYINSKIYSAGTIHDFQWYYRIERFKQSKEIFYGVYAIVITHDDEQAKAEFKGYIHEEKRANFHKLSFTKKFPKKKGFQFIGFIRKSCVRDDAVWYHRLMPEDNLTLNFKIFIKFKKYSNELMENYKVIWKNKKYTDFTMVVKGQEFLVHKTVLAARSPFFANLFEQNDLSDTYEINEIEPEVMEILLRFIYTGKLMQLIKFLKDIYAAANKFELNKLKCICEKAMLSYS